MRTTLTALLSSVVLALAGCASEGSFAADEAERKPECNSPDPGVSLAFCDDYWVYSAFQRSFLQARLVVFSGYFDLTPEEALYLTQVLSYRLESHLAEEYGMAVQEGNADSKRFDRMGVWPPFDYLYWDALEAKLSAGIGRSDAEGAILYLQTGAVTTEEYEVTPFVGPVTMRARSVDDE